MSTQAPLIEKYPTNQQRKVILALLGALWILQGIEIFSKHEVWVADKAIIYLGWPFGVRVILWCSTGILACLGAVKGTKLSERIGWTVLALMPIERFFLHAYSGIAWIIPGAPGGDPWAPLHMARWALIWLVIWLLAGGSSRVEARDRKIAFKRSKDLKDD